MIFFNINQIQTISGGVGSFGVFDECLIGEEFAFGCSGITTAIGGTSLGVSAVFSLKGNK